MSSIVDELIFTVEKLAKAKARGTGERKEGEDRRFANVRNLRSLLGIMYDNLKNQTTK